MKKTFIVLAVTVIFCSLCNWQQMLQAQTQPIARGSFSKKIYVKESENKLILDERQRQVPAIIAAFSRYADVGRARRLADLCYKTTLGTVFMPMDLAEIAMAETAGHGLSSKAVSVKGAVGVWQLMPFRAKSHGYSPEEMLNDEKCAAAAVRELSSKLMMARGSMSRAKKLYCGTGPDADLYEVRRKQFRREIMQELNNLDTKSAEIFQNEAAHSS
jgi:hypothetical protein